MDIKATSAGSVATICLGGRFDFNAYADFKDVYTQLVQDAKVTAIDVNLASVEYLDSSALGMLLMLRHRALEVNKSVTLSKPNQGVAQVLNIAKFSKMFLIT